MRFGTSRRQESRSATGWSITTTEDRIPRLTISRRASSMLGFGLCLWQHNVGSQIPPYVCCRTVQRMGSTSQTLRAIHGLRFVASSGRMPPPLEDSPKCPRCSLVGICLPDEVNFLRRAESAARPLAVGRDSALPLYIQANQAKVAKKGETLEISVRSEERRVGKEGRSRRSQ